MRDLIKSFLTITYFIYHSPIEETISNELSEKTVFIFRLVIFLLHFPYIYIFNLDIDRSNLYENFVSKKESYS